MKIKLIIPPSVKRFIKDYRLPIMATAAFILLILFLLVGRIHDRASLDQVLAVKKSANGGYDILQSNDAADNYKKRDVSTDNTANINPGSQQSTVSNSVFTATPPTSPTPSPATPPSPGTPPPAPTPPPVVNGPFSAFITDFRQEQPPSFQCPNGSTGNFDFSKCSKTYRFTASVQTAKGPGTVGYDWIESINGGSNGSFAAASGTNMTTLHNQITLSCNNPRQFTTQFALTSPSQVQSSPLYVNHSCP